MDLSSKRVQWIDAARALGAVFVILCHCTEIIYPIYKLDTAYVASLNLFSRIFAFSAFTLWRFGVPLFLMITGWLLLDRQYDSKSVIHFWKGSCLRLFLCTEIWIIIYDIISALLGSHKLSVGFLVERMLFVRQSPMNHIWYMPMILGMYFFLPLIANALHSVDVSKLKYIVMIFTIYAFFIPTVNIVIRSMDGKPLSSLFSMGFSGGTYGIYIIAGYLIKKGILKNSNLLYWLQF